MTGIERGCKYYNDGRGGIEHNWPAFPGAYGSRCEYFDEFFTRYVGKVGEDIVPVCSKCPKDRKEKQVV